MAENRVVIYTAGMSDVRWFDRRFVKTLRGAGMRVLVNRWCRSWWPLKNLRDRSQHEDAGRELGEMVARLREESSKGDGIGEIVLAGHSTGCLITLEMLERLGEPIDRALLLAAAVRPDYDLRGALDGARRVDHFWSYLDPACSWGTAVAGTADGAYRWAAGATGFSGPGSDDGRFVQHRFEKGWAMHGHIGGHTTCLHPRFVMNVVLPVLRCGAEASGRSGTD